MNEMASIIGDGQMALVLADALAVRGVPARIWSPFSRDATSLQITRRSPRLPEMELPRNTEVTDQDGLAFDGCTIIFSAIPTQHLRSVWRRLRPHVRADVCLVSVTKGIEIGTNLRPSEVIEDVLAGESNGVSDGSRRNASQRIVVLSGPTIASELARRLPASLVAASNHLQCAERVQELLRVPWLRVYRNDDVLGVEIAGATKNVIALAAGMIDGLEAGSNAKSALLARGLAEIARLGCAMGAKLDTFFGVAGVGDLATTCFSPEGRNRTCGERLARGESLENILASSTSVVEGVPTAKAVVQLARAHGIDMPIAQAVHAILFEGLSPEKAIHGLMSRELKVESVG
jgi:glycerol-3-phosphate dehydrogenase (NAD(P)+)